MGHDQYGSLRNPGVPLTLRAVSADNVFNLQGKPIAVIKRSRDVRQVDNVHIMRKLGLCNGLRCTAGMQNEHL